MVPRGWNANNSVDPLIFFLSLNFLKFLHNSWTDCHQFGTNTHFPLGDELQEPPWSLHSAGIGPETAACCHCPCVRVSERWGKHLAQSAALLKLPHRARVGLRPRCSWGVRQTFSSEKSESSSKTGAHTDQCSVCVFSSVVQRGVCTKISDQITSADGSVFFIVVFGVAKLPRSQISAVNVVTVIDQNNN